MFPSRKVKTIVALFVVAAMFVMTESQKSQLPSTPDFPACVVHDN
jgi:hypothetical protein